MTGVVNGEPKAIPHDGWKSRTIIAAAIVLLVIIAIATTCLFLERPGPEPGTLIPVATFAQWITIVQWVIPSVLLPTFTKLGVDKWAQARVQK